MAMAIAWHTLNKAANPHDKRFTDAFLVVAPGITIRDRLRVLRPSDPANYYRALDLIPAEHLTTFGAAKVVVTNFHAFKPRETVEAQKGIVVLNDEAHHCYRGKPDAAGEKLTGDEKKEAAQRDEEARLWLTGLEAIHKKVGVKAAYDLSATPFYLKGSGYPEGTLFPWVVSDFSLIDAIESGIVKIPRVPVQDDTLGGNLPAFRELWVRIRDDLPKKGRGLRRASYTLNEKSHFDSEYAEVYGVPFQFIPCAGEGKEKDDKDPLPKPGRIKAVPERLALRPHLEIAFPRVAGYRYEMPPDRLTAAFSQESQLVLSTAELPTKSVNSPIVGESVTMTLDEMKKKREQEVAFAIAREVLTNYYPADPGAADPADASKVWLFPQVFEIVRRWVRECVVLKDSVFPQLLLLAQLRKAAAEKVHRAIAAAAAGEPRVRAVLQPYDTVGTSSIVSFDSRRSRFQTDPARCHVNFVVYDSDWERHFAQTLEDLDPVKAYVKNEHLGFKIPYTHEGKPRHYYPDYLVRVDDGRGPGDLLTLVVELSGQELEDKQSKVDTARALWVPAVNAERRFGRWAFLEITDPLSAKGTITKFLKGLNAV